MSFNLLHEPWIPVAVRGGRVKEFGIAEILREAHRLGGVSDPAPPIQFGIYRLLVAFVADALAISELEDIEALLNQGCFPEDRVAEYVRGVGENRFDLFDPETPFLQTPASSGDGEAVSSVVRLFQHLPSGGFITHFHHIDTEGQGFSPAVCARGLVTIAPFMTAGGAGYSPSVNGNPPWYALVAGRTLFETILLNCCAVPVPGIDGTEPPAWRSAKPVEPKKETRCTSLLEGLTWRPRRVRLNPGPGGTCTYSGAESPVLVRTVYFSYGLKSAGGWTDPQVAYRITDKGPLPLRPREDRELWRDIGPLMLLRKEEYKGSDGEVRFECPIVVGQLRQLKQARILPQAFPETIEVYGFRTDGKMKIFEWYCDKLSLPPGLTGNPRAGQLTQAAQETGEWVAYAIQKSLKTAYPREGAGNKRAFGSLIGRAHREFWAALRPRFERDWLEPLASGVGDEAAERDLLEGWRRTAVDVGQAQFDAALQSLDADADSLRRQVAAGQHFRRSAYRILHPELAKKKKAKKRGDE